MHATVATLSVARQSTEPKGAVPGSASSVSPWGAMSGDNLRRDPDLHVIEQAIRRRVIERAGEWFPDLPRPETVHVRALSTRPRCLLYVVHLGNGTGVPQILAKVRRDGPVEGNDTRGPGRPTLRVNSATAAELTSFEFDGLSAIVALFGQSHPTFGAIRPLDQLVPEATLLMDYVEARTLRELTIAESRLMPRGRSARRRRASSDSWHHAGGWLRIFQQSTGPDTLPSQPSVRQDVVNKFHAYHDFLTAQLGPRSFGDVATRGAEWAANSLPEQLPQAVGHSDYAPRNMFVDGRGRLIVYDPMPRWSVPSYEDLCRLLVGLRLLGLQLHSHGAAFSQRELDYRERDVLSGYYDGDPIPFDQLRCYELLILLDKWSALVDLHNESWRSRLHSTSVRWASGYLRHQANQLLDAS